MHQGKETVTLLAALQSAAYQSYHTELILHLSHSYSDVPYALAVCRVDVCARGELTTCEKEL